jgi:hypothetical protein
MLIIELSLYTILKILSVTVFEKVPTLQVLTDNEYINLKYCYPNQLNLFDFKPKFTGRNRVTICGIVNYAN